MRTDEIMMGDHLCYRGRFNVFPFKVQQVTKKKIGYHAEPGENRMYYLSFHECFPIPLTENIMLRNGFKDIGNKTYRWEYAEGIYIQVDFISEEPCAYVSNKCYYACPVCRYVHELQHALKVCGINKEITL